MKPLRTSRASMQTSSIVSACLEPKAREARSAVLAGGITTLVTIANIAVGFGFQALVAAQLGTSELADSFQLAWAFVTFGAVTFFSLVPTLLIPRIQSSDGKIIAIGDGWTIGLIGLAFSAIQLLFGLFTWHSNSASEALVWSSPAHLLAALSSLPQAIAYIGHRFGLAAAGGFFNGVGLLVCFIVLSQHDLSPGDLGLCLTVGYLVQATATVAPLTLNSPVMVATRTIPVVAISGFVCFTLITKLQPLLERILTTDGSEGATAALGFGQKIAQGLLLVGAFGLSVNAAASLSRLVQSQNYAAAARTLVRTTVLTAVITSAAIGAFLPASAVLTRLLLVRGSFTDEDAVLVWDIAMCQVPWVIACALTGPLTSYLYVARQYRRVLVVAAAGLVVTWLTAKNLTALAADLRVPVASSLGSLACLAVVVVLLRTDKIFPEVQRALRSYRWAIFATSISLGLMSTLAFYIALLDIDGRSVGTCAALTAPLLMLAIATLTPRLKLEFADALGGRLSLVPRIYAITVGDRHAASSRVRVFDLWDYLAIGVTKQESVVAHGKSMANRGTSNNRSLATRHRAGPEVQPPRVLALLLRVLARKLVYELDDAIYLGYPGTRLDANRSADRTFYIVKLADAVLTTSELIKKDLPAECRRKTSGSPGLRLRYGGPPCLTGRLTNWFGWVVPQHTRTSKPSSFLRLLGYGMSGSP